MFFQKIILASQSPRRQQLLNWADIDFEVMVSDIEETWPEGLDEAAIAIHIARNKALNIQQKVETSETSALPILAADTIVVLEGRVIGKPRDREEAIHTLILLSGKAHRVITGVCLLTKEGEKTFSETTTVEFHELSLQQIEYYVDNYRPYDKAGAYAIQEWIGVVGIKKITGDFYNVMGLPVSLVVKTLFEGGFSQRKPSLPG